MDRIDLDSLLDLAPDERGAGDSTLTLSRTAWQELVYDREADSYEAQRAPVGMEVVAARHVDHLRRSIDAVGDDLHVLRARSLVTVDDGLTIAGLLLLGDHPQRYLEGYSAGSWWCSPVRTTCVRLELPARVRSARLGARGAAAPGAAVREIAGRPPSTSLDPRARLPE